VVDCTGCAHADNAYARSQRLNTYMVALTLCPVRARKERIYASLPDPERELRKPRREYSRCIDSTFNPGRVLRKSERTYPERLCLLFIVYIYMLYRSRNASQSPHITPDRHFRVEFVTNINESSCRHFRVEFVTNINESSCRHFRVELKCMQGKRRRRGFGILSFD
jgi:hypothetical protein